MANEGLLTVLETRRSDLRRFLAARTGSEADADDLMSELWIKVRAADAGPIGNPEGYLFRMANNLVLDRVREAQRRNRRERDWTTDRHGHPGSAGEITDPSDTAEQLLLAEDEAERLRRAIADLPPGAQRVLKMHKLDGLSHGEVAAQLGISKSAVEKHMAVAMAYLRRLLKD